MNTGLEVDEFTGLNPAQRIPNIENRNLQTKIINQQQQFQSTQNNLDENVTKVRIVEDHFKNVQDELLTTQRLINACKNETETEEHIKVVNQREISRVKHNILQIENELISMKHRKSIFTEEIVRANQLVNKLKAQIQWDEQDLETHLEGSARKDEDVMALMKYTRQDEVKVKELMLKIERMSEESTENKRAIENEILDTNGFQIELDKTANHFRRSHLHRQELIKRWKDIIQQMHQRDRDIDLLAFKLIKIKGEVHSMDEQINAKRKFYDKEQRLNNEQEVQMSLAERRAAKLRMQYDEAEKTRLLYENEVSDLRRVVERTGKDTEISYALVNQMKKQLTQRRQYLTDVITHNNELINNKSEILNANYTSEENANKMDQLYLEEQEHEMRLNSRLKLLSEQLYKITQEVSDYKAKVITLEVEINGSLVTLNHLQAKTNQLDNEGLKQQQVLYHQDFEIQSFERRINRMQGEKSFEEQIKLERKIIELQIEMKQKRDDYRTLTNQTKQIHEELKRLRKYFDEINREKSIELRHIEELELHDDKAQRLVKKMKDEKENFLVDEHFMRIEIKRLRSLLNSKADNVMNLETRRVQLQTVIKERRNDVSIHQSTLRQHIRKKEGRTSELSAQLHDRIAKIEKLKIRYEIVNISMLPPEGVKKEETSQAYYVIKATEEKEELQRKGDELNGKTQKAERELLALQNTLRILHNENDQIKTSYKKSIDPNNRKRQQILKLENDCKDIERKLTQTDRNISSNKKSTQSARQQTKVSIEEDDFELRILKEFNKKLDLLIDQTVSMDSDAKHCYNILKQQSHFDELSNTASTSLSLSSSSISRTSSRQTASIAPIQLSLEGSRLLNGHRQQRRSSSVKRVVK